MDSYSTDNGAYLAILAATVIVTLIIVLAVYVISAIFLTKVFAKAGVSTPAVAWIPVYNSLILAKLGDVNPWAYLIVLLGSSALSAIPVIGFIFALVPLVAFVLIAYRVNLKLGKDATLFTILAVLVGLIWLGIVAFDKSRWSTAAAPLEGAAPVPVPFWSKYSFLVDTTTWGGVPYQGYPVVPAA